MDAAALDAHRTWGVQCGDDQIVWVEDEAAAYRLLTSLVGAQRVVRRAEHGELCPAPKRRNHQPR